MPQLVLPGLSCCTVLRRQCSARFARSVHRPVCAAVDSKRADLFKGVSSDNRIAVAQTVERAERAAAQWGTAHSDFLVPTAASEALGCIARLSGVSALPWGGYAQAERCRLVLGNKETIAALSNDLTEEGGVAALNVKGNFIFDAATHRDFLGALLGTGIEREKVGDILVQGETGAQILVVPELIDHLEFNLTQVRSVSVVTRAVPLTELVVRAPKVEEVRSVEASLRLDAVASAGLRISRAKASDLAKNGDLRGKGRVEVTDVTKTKKGRYAIAMVRYV